MSRGIVTAAVVLLFAVPLMAEPARPDVRRPVVPLGDAPTSAGGPDIVVNANGEVWFGGELRSWVDLDRELGKARRKVFRIAADRHAPWRAVRYALVAAREVGSAILEVQGPAGKVRLWRPRIESEDARGLILVFHRNGKATSVLTRHDDELGRVSPPGSETELGETIAEFVEFHELGGVVITAAGDPNWGEVARLAAICRSAKAGDLILFAGPHPLEYAADRPTPPASGKTEEPAAVRRGPAVVRPAAAEAIRKAVSLPTVTSPRVSETLDEEMFEVLVTKDRAIWAGGARQDGWRSLATWLRPHAKERIEKSPLTGRVGTGPSMLPVILRADRSAIWSDIVSVLKICVHPDLRIARLHFEVVDGEGKAVLMPMFLLTNRFRPDRASIVVAIDKPAGETASFTVEMVRKRGGAITTILMDGKAATPDRIGSRIRTLRKEGKSPLPYLAAWESVPFGEVVRMVAACREACGLGFRDPRIRLD